MNQRDSGEKSRQVPRMTEIFSEASTVCAWLGKSNDNSDLALEFIRTKLSDFWSFNELIKEDIYMKA